MSRVIQCEPWHLLSVAHRIPDRDRRELELLGYRDWQEVAVQRAAEAGVKFSVVDAQGVPHVCFGISESRMVGVGTLWMVRAVGAERFVKAGAQALRRIVASGEYRRIETHSKADCGPCRKFIEWLGFAYEGTRKGFFTDGSDMDQFAIVRQS
jgi:hypothetical protein